MFKLFAKKKGRVISSIDQALSIITELKKSPGLDKVVARSDINGVDLTKENMVDIVQQHFKPEPDYNCNGTYSIKGKKHTVKLEYSLSVLEEEGSYIHGFATARLGGWSPGVQFKPTMRRHVVHKATIDFYMK
ncbi:hypothetical protein JW756_06305 [Candidatus Woesearchaeota archaeon]|nr:hypothetical protein [Candidatus Woesearchaeota archaeon]